MQNTYENPKECLVNPVIRKFLGWLTMLRNKSEIIASCYTFLVQKHNLYFLHFIIWEYHLDIICTWPLFPHCSVLNITIKII